MSPYGKECTMHKHMTMTTGRASLCALGEYLRRHCFFAPLRESVRSCTSSVRVIPSPAHQVQYPHFTTWVRGLCHGITPVFLPAHVPGAPLALRHAALCLAKRVSRRGSEAIRTSAAAVQAFQRPEAVSWPHPQAPLCRL